MKQHEREYFISRVRSGIYIIKENEFSLKIITPTIIQEYEACQIYYETYLKAIEDEIKTEDEIVEWMIEKELWTDEDETKFNGLKKDIEKLKIEIFNARNNSKLKETIRLYIRQAEKQLKKINEKKNSYYGNTCEGIASLEKSLFLLRNCTYLNNSIYNFDLYSLDHVWYRYCSLILSESQCRYLARNEPWRSLWVLNQTNTVNLFYNKDTELSIDQKNLLIWSKMYDNIQESMDCPSQDVIDDDDMLDGWFLCQKNKQEKEKAEREFENSNINPKIKNSSEIFIMSNSKEDSDRINNMNDIGSKIVKNQRLQVIKNQRGASQLDFMDEKIKLNQQSNEMFKQKFRR